MVKCPFKFDFSSLMTDEPKGFLGIPLKSDISGSDLVFAALPCELDRSAKPGAAKGAAYLRRDLFGFGLCDQGLDIDMSASINACDCGNLMIDNSSDEAVENSVYEAQKAVLSAGAAAFFIGGDDMTAYPQIKACAEQYGKISVVHMGGEISSALMRAAKEGLIDAKHSVEVGVRNGFAEYGKDLTEQGITVITAADANYITMSAICEKIKQTVGDNRVIFLFDVNFFDPAFVTAAAKPYPGGFSSYETVMVMENALVGLDIKSAAAYGMLDYNDAGETSLNNFAEAVSKIYAVLALNISE